MQRANDRQRWTTRGWRIPSSLPAADDPEGLEKKWVPKAVALQEPAIRARVASVGISRLRDLWSEYREFPEFVEAWHTIGSPPEEVSETHLDRGAGPTMGVARRPL